MTASARLGTASHPRGLGVCHETTPLTPGNLFLCNILAAIRGWGTSMR